MSPKRLVLKFLATTSDKPLIYQLVKDYGLMINILKAVINPQKEGMMVVEIQGEKENYEKGLNFLRSLGVSIEPLSNEVTRTEEKCTQCGACSNFCPTGALYLKRPEMEISFNDDKCIACLLCVKACPARAMEVSF